MDVEVRIDRNRCIGSGQCVFVAPRAFDQDGDAKAYVTDPQGEPEEKIVHAVTACPVQAISLHLGGSRVGPDDLKDWMLGIRSDDPVVELLGQFSDEHHELQAALGAARAHHGSERIDELSSLTRTHLRTEEEAYSAITALVDPDLVAAFDADHLRIDQALDALGAEESDAEQRARAMGDLTRAVSEHIRLEETVLFPAALAALGRRVSR